MLLKNKIFKSLFKMVCISFFLVSLFLSVHAENKKGEIKKPEKSLNFLFLGNSFTSGPNLPDIFLNLSEEGQPEIKTSVTMVAYGGHKLFYHWHLRKSYNMVRINSLTKPELEKEINLLSPDNFPENPPDWFTKAEGKHAPRRWKNLTKEKTLNYIQKRHKEWLKLIGKAPKWNYVVLQSWKDMDENNSGSFFNYATKFGVIAKKEGAKVVLYITSSYSQNQTPVKKPLAVNRALKETRLAKKLAEKIDALVVPMPLAVYYAQQERPDITFRYVNNFHLNHNSAYLAACLLYGAVFNTSPEGLKYNVVMGLGPSPELDHDGKPRRQVLNDEIRLYLQKLAWKTIQSFKKGDF